MNYAVNMNQEKECFRSDVAMKPALHKSGFLCQFLLNQQSEAWSSEFKNNRRRKLLRKTQALNSVLKDQAHFHTVQSSCHCYMKCFPLMFVL